MSGRDERPPRNRDVGGGRPIPRRDFLQGALIGAASTLCGPLLRAHAAEMSMDPGASQDQRGYYPPLLTGLRGSHPGSYEAAHALRDGHATGSERDTRESYDLIVVGGGI